MSSRSCWNVSRSVWTNALRWVKNCSLRRWAVFDMLACLRGGWVTLECVIVSLEHSREAVLPWEEHAGPAASGAFHHRPAWSVLHGTVDRRICLPEPGQVRGSYRHTLKLILNGTRKRAKIYFHTICIILQLQSSLLNQGAHVLLCITEILL